jgi:hypothetical protein
VKKLPLLITVVILILPVGGYFLYKEFISKPPIDSWNLVPQSSVFVYESGNCETCVESVKKSAVWEIIEKASFYGKETDSLKSIFRFLKDSKYSLISVHATKKDDFDFVFYCRTKSQNLKPSLDQWSKNKQFKFSEREFNSVKIHEVSCSNNVFSWIFIEDIWVGSFTPFLIEDVVRAFESNGEISFKKSVADAYQFPKTDKDGGNLYVHLKNLSEWLNVFTTSKQASFIQDFGKSSILDIKTSMNNFILNGFSSDSINQSDYILSVFTGQSPVPFNMKNLISERTMLLTSYGISNGESFGKKLLSSKKRNPTYNDTLKQLSSSLQFSKEKIFDNIKGEMSLCYVESKGKSLAKILLIGTTDSKKWIDVFNSIAVKTSIDTIFYDRYADYEIRELPIYRFPEKLFAPLISGFDRSYYTTLGNMIIIGDDLDELKRFLDDIDKEETWGKSVNQNRFLESTLLESNISVFINTGRIWNVVSDLTTEKWKSFISENSILLQSLDMGAIQFSHLNQGFYTNATWSYNPIDHKQAQNKRDNKKTSTNFETDIVKMFIVKNHTDRNDEILVQDSLRTIHLISSQGEVLWSKNLNAEINGDVYQVDIFNNGKLQYFFVSDNKLHVIDRLGNYVAPYPLAITVKDVEYVSVVDYDHSKKYRFLISTKSGSLWMFDKGGNSLDGWTPKKVDEGFLISPRHHRLRGKDYIMAVRRDGNVFLINRRGETIKNFPVNIDGRPSGDYFVETGDTPANTFFVFVTRDGFRVKINLEGKIVSRETLLKTSPDAQFALIPELKSKSYLINRQEPRQLILSDEAGKQLLVNEYVGLNPVVVKYSDFGAGNIFVTITDKSQNLSFVYDKDGNLVTTPPLESDITQVTYSGNHPKIYAVYQKAVSVHAIP